MTTQERFWETGALDTLTERQWESLCDGCARCCLQKLADEDTGAVYYTDVACPLLDVEECRCKDYDHRHSRMPTCRRLTPETVADTLWLPSTCAYRLRALGRPLPRWHHLVTGSMSDMHRYEASVRGKAVSLAATDDDVLISHIVETVPTDTGLHLFLPVRAGSSEGAPS